MAKNEDSYVPTYRQRDVDETLDDHDRRITRLEKGALLAAGYALANGADLAGLLGMFL